jgi:hypothetical protein
MQNLKNNCSIVRHKKLFFNNIFFDTSKIDIDSEVERDLKYGYQKSHNSSLKKNKSYEKSINLSIERSIISNRD